MTTDSPWTGARAVAERGEPLLERTWPVWIDGEILALERAALPLGSAGVLHGRAVFTTIPVLAGLPLFTAQHVARLVRDGAALGIPLAVGALRAAIAALLPHLSGAASAVRVHLGAGEAGGAPHLALIPRRAAAGLGAGQGGETVLAVHGESFGGSLARHKLAQRVGRNLALQAAAAAGADEVLLADSAGAVLGCAAACVVMRAGGRVFAPGPRAGGLPGVARAVLAHRCGAPDGPHTGAWLDQPVPAAIWARAEEIVLVGSVRGVRAARAVLGRSTPLAGAAGPLAALLARAWEDALREESVAAREEWGTSPGR